MEEKLMVIAESDNPHVEVVDEGYFEIFGLLQRNKDGEGWCVNTSGYGWVQFYHWDVLRIDPPTSWAPRIIMSRER